MRRRDIVGASKGNKFPNVVKKDGEFVIGFSSRPRGIMPFTDPESGVEGTAHAIELHFSRRDGTNAELSMAACRELAQMIDERSSYLLVDRIRDSSLIVLYGGDRPLDEATARFCSSVRDLLSALDLPVEKWDVSQAMAVHSTAPIIGRDTDF